MTKERTRLGPQVGWEVIVRDSNLSKYLPLPIDLDVGWNWLDVDIQLMPSLGYKPNPLKSKPRTIAKAKKILRELEELDEELEDDLR